MLIKHGILKGKRLLFVKFKLQSNNYGIYEKCNQKWFNPQSKKQIAIAVAISLVCAIPISTFAQVLKFSIKE
ncbi:hypothetical protein NXW59_22465 [Bacteroides fragilis]|nr:hypothetical protein [Bacteroides fragilis]